MDFDIVIETKEEIVDMKTGLDTMQGASEVVRIVAETAVSGVVPSRKSHKSSVRTNLKKSFKGSYGHTFSLDFYDHDKKQKFEALGGEAVFMEVMSFLIAEALYQQPVKKLTPEGQHLINEIGENYDDLLNKLRQSPLNWLHESPNKLNYPVKLRYRKEVGEKTKKTLIARLDRATALSLGSTIDGNDFQITACITRFNIHTGNGRLLLKGEEDTIPFSIAIPYRHVNLKTKKVFSHNLDTNNGINDNDAREYLNLTVRKVNNHGGHVVKYIIVGV
ncbi:hypothetical protein QPB21_001246 [Vibrio alginolyticus]|nr:hypothetical protein [Vibrio alginolyticus]